MKIAFNPSTVAALIAPPNNKDITFDLRGQNIFARGVKFCGTDTNTWRDIKINNVSIDSNTLDLRDGDNTTLTNINGVVTINSTWRPVVDNLTSDSTTSSLSANQGRVLKALIDGKSDSGHTHDDRYVKRSGDTMLGALNFANGTWNLVGDDSYMGDCNISGHFGIKAANTTYPGIAFFNNANDYLGNLTAYSGNIKYGAYSLQFLDNGNTSVSASTWTNPFNDYNSNAVADGQAICVWGQSSYLGNLANDTGDMSLWLKRVNANVATLNMVLDGEYYANGSQRLAHVSEIPTSLKNPYALTLQANGTTLVTYDGSVSKIVNLTYDNVGASAKNHTHNSLEPWASYITGDSHATALKSIFDKNKTSIPRNKFISMYSSAYSNGSYYMGYFLQGYENNPYGGFFVAHYDAAYYIGIDNGSFVQHRLVYSTDIPTSLKNPYALTISLNGTSQGPYDGSAAKNINITPSSIGAAISDHNHDGRYVKRSGDTMLGALNFANGTWNLVGDDSYMGDCNISGHFGIKAANTTYPGIAFFNNANDYLGNLTAYSGNIKYGAYSLQFLDNGNTSVSASTWTNPFNDYNSNAVADGQAICVWGQSSYLGNLANDTGDMSLWLKRVNANVATLNMVLDGEYYANGSQRLAHVSEIPTSLKNPYALTLQANGTTLVTYDGSVSKIVNLTYDNVGASAKNHTHNSLEPWASYITGDSHATALKSIFDKNKTSIPRNKFISMYSSAYSNGSYYMGYFLQGYENNPYGGFFVAHYDAAYYIGIDNGSFVQHRLVYSTDIPTSLKNPYALTISLNGTSQGPYDGSAAKNINITPSSIGAAISDHNHDGRYVYNYGGTADVNGQALSQNALFMSTTSGITEDWWHILQAAWNDEYRWNSQIAFPTQNRNGMYYRSGLDDNTAWGAWVKLLDTNNYAAILDSRYYTESEVDSLLDAKLNRQNLSYGTWNPRGYNLAADYSYNGGDLSISESGGQIHVSVDGYFWQNEGQYRVLDTSDVAGLKNNLTVHQYLSNTDTTWWPLIWGGDSHNNTNDSTGAVYKSHDVLSWQTSSQTLYATHLQTTYIDLQNNRGISQVTSGGTSPYKGIRLPYLQGDGIGIFSRTGNSTDEGGIVLSEDTCVIYNSFDTGWGLSVRDKDRNQTDISGDDTIAFGVRQDYRAYSLGGFEKSGSNNSYVLLGGGGHKLESSLNVASASVASKVYGQVGDTGSHELVRCDMNNDQFRIIAGSNGNNNGWAEIATADDGSEPIYVRQYTGVFSSVRRTLTLLDESGNTTFPGSLSIGGQIIRGGYSTTWVQGRNVALLRETIASGYHTLWSLKTTNGSWDFGEYVTSGWYNVPVLSYITDSNYNSGNNTTTYQIKFPLASGTVALTSYGGDNSHPIFLGYLNLDHGNDGTVSSSFYCLGYSVPFTYTRGGNYCRINIPDTSYQVFYIRAAIASVNYSGGGMDTWVGEHRGDGAWWLHCYASSTNEVRVKGFHQRNNNNDGWWGGNPLWSGSSGANRITVCIFGYVTFR